MDEILHRPGFLGTAGNLAADATLVMMVGIAALFSVGFYLARQGKFETHKWVQTAGVVLNLILVLWLMVLPFRDFILRDSGGPRERVFYTITAIHALLGFLGVVVGNFVLLRGHNLVPSRLRFNNYKFFMRTAYGLYVLATIFGVGVYYVWFVAAANPPTF